MTKEHNRKLAALKKTPFFQSLSSNELEKLSTVFVVESYPVRHLLVQQDDEADQFFIILSGKAEVWLQKNTKDPVLLATLGEGDIVGHIDIDAQKPVKRNATVIAETPITVMSASVSDLEPFFQGYPDIQKRFREYRKRTEIINFVKSSTPFIDISSQTANELVDNLKIKDIEQGKNIINQGDLANECYFIQQGTVSVIIKDEEGNEKVVKELNRGDLFGELGLFEGHRRNATVRADTPCRLYALSREHFLSILKRHDTVAQKVSYLSKHRNRPNKSKGIEVIKQIRPSGKKVYILKNPQTNRYLRLQEEGWYLWEKMDGIKTIHELIIGYLEEHGKFMPQQIMKLILDLDDMGMIDMTYYRPTSQSLSLSNRVVKWLSHIFELKFTFRNVDQKFTQIYNRVGHIIYHKSVIFSLSILIILGIVTFFFTASESQQVFKSMPDNYQYLIYIYLTLPVTITLHEFAHGLTTKAIGCEVGGFGVGWYWFGPIAFCDTTDAWLAPPGDRIKVNIAGAFSDLSFAGISSLLAFVLSGTFWGGFFWLLSSSFYVICFINLGTLIELDGYYILADILDEPNLRRKSFLWIDKLPKQIFHLDLLKQNYKFVTYWVVTLIHLVVAVYIYSYFQNNILFYMMPQNIFEVRGYLQLIIPCILIVLIFKSVRADFKKYH